MPSEAGAATKATPTKQQRGEVRLITRLAVFVEKVHPGPGPLPPLIPRPSAPR